MVGDAVELIVGVVNDISFGPVVALGLGGTAAEVLRDVSYRVAPFGIEEASEMIAELRSAALLGPWRGRPPRDVGALAGVVSRVSQLAWTLRDSLVEMDINPLLVRAEGEGALAADALIVLK
jgi:acyl-CoA synthetase (NDP forming)